MKYLLLILSLAFVIFFAFQQDQKAKAFKTSSVAQDSMTPEKDDTDNVQNIINTSDELTAKWLDALGSGNWLYLASKYETTEDVGMDPETGLPLPNKSLWENWYTLDADGRQTIYLLRRTDLERGNVDYVAWQNDRLYRLPGGTIEDTRQQGDAWRTFRPLIDDSCNSHLRTFLSPADDGITKKISAELISVPNREKWVFTSSIEHSPVSDVSGYPGSVFTGAEFICYRDNQSGAPEGFELFLITEKGERVLLNREYDVIAQWVDDIPTEMFDILQQLNSAEPKR
jgi:hypothetical protein